MAEPNRRLMNLNAAGEHELTQLPRIGADKARRIVRCRAIRKGFRDWEDFARTPGITAEDVEAIRMRAWIGPPADLRRTELDRGRTGHAEAMVRRPRAKAS
ncbi:MAG TPA: helix-hairpin-helix domain-containing protein [Candidatus Methylomirabilis sp.]|nr:helix-hairpin-helix domain-containing protein [Candidatus Methylomirabilis sp.]